MISLLLIIVAALFFPGIVAIIKAKIGGHKLPHILQPVFDVIRLFKKGSIYSTTTGLIFKMAPPVYFATVLLAMLFIPFANMPGLLSFQGDFVFFAYLLALGKFMLIIGAMDTGSGFEGMGANREALYSMLVEPAFFIVLGSMALFTGNTSFSELYQSFWFHNHLSFAIGIAAIYVFIYITMVENSRMPVDDPRTHLELTMVHEVMILDNSGFDLALMHISSWLKFAIYGGLISNFLVQSHWSFYIQLTVFLATQVTFAVVVGLLESFKARNKMEKNPQWIITLSAIAVVIFLTALIITQKIILN